MFLHTHLKNSGKSVTNPLVDTCFSAVTTCHDLSRTMENRAILVGNNRSNTKQEIPVPTRSKSGCSNMAIDILYIGNAWDWGNIHFFLVGTGVPGNNKCANLQRSEPNGTPSMEGLPRPYRLIALSQLSAMTPFFPRPSPTDGTTNVPP